MLSLKSLEFFGGVLISNTFADDAQVLVEISIDQLTGDKYFIYTTTGDVEEEIVYKYPDVNPIVYQVLNLIQAKGDSFINENSMLCGPHLCRNSPTKYAICPVVKGQLHLVDLPVSPATAPVMHQEFIKTLF